jgi:hypothetical protein
MLTKVGKIYTISNFMKICLAALKLLYADGWTNMAKHFGEPWSQIHHREKIMQGNVTIYIYV